MKCRIWMSNNHSNYVYGDPKYSYKQKKYTLELMATIQLPNANNRLQELFMKIMDCLQEVTTFKNHVLKVDMIKSFPMME